MLVTASGAPGTAALLRALRENGEREGPARRHGHVRAGDRPPPLRRLPPRAGRLGPRLRRRDARGRRARGGRRRAAAVVVRPRAGSRTHRDRFPVPVLVSSPGDDPPLERQGGDLRAAAADRRHGARLPARQRRAGGRRRRPASSATRSGRLLQAGLLVRLARLPRARPDRRPRAPAAARAARARWRCGWRRRSSCCRTRAGPSCS